MKKIVAKYASMILSTLAVALVVAPQSPFIMNSPEVPQELLKK